VNIKISKIPKYKYRIYPRVLFAVSFQTKNLRWIRGKVPMSFKSDLSQSQWKIEISISNGNSKLEHNWNWNSNKAYSNQNIKIKPKCHCYVNFFSRKSISHANVHQKIVLAIKKIGYIRFLIFWGIPIDRDNLLFLKKSKIQLFQFFSQKQFFGVALP
jgi:hypothetical protein